MANLEHELNCIDASFKLLSTDLQHAVDKVNHVHKKIAAFEKQFAEAQECINNQTVMLGQLEARLAQMDTTCAAFLSTKNYLLAFFLPPAEGVWLKKNSRCAPEIMHVSCPFIRYSHGVWTLTEGQKYRLRAKLKLGIHVGTQFIAWYNETKGERINPSSSAQAYLPLNHMSAHNQNTVTEGEVFCEVVAERDTNVALRALGPAEFYIDSNSFVLIEIISAF